jgi:nucleoside-diphosphate-sugar epimerase
VAGRAVTAEFEPARPFDRHDAWLDPAEAERTLGWRARIHLEEGVREMWERVEQDHAPAVDRLRYKVGA